MELCNKCLFYNPDHDEFRSMWDDVSDDAEPNEKKRYCHMYDNHIPAGIVTGKALCEFFMLKE